MRNITKITREASIIIVTYNHMQYIADCIKSVKQNDPYEIIIVDNCSSDNIINFVKKNFSDIKIIKNSKNVGYGRAINIGIKYAQGKYIVILNPDTTVKDNWLKELLKPLRNKQKIITTPKILKYNGKINACGNIVHFTGLAFARGLDSNINKFNAYEYISGISGACFAIRKKDLLALGGFDKNFFLYNEDTEFSWRAHLNGYKILYVPTSIVYHDYELKVYPEKLYHLEKGRYIILRKYLSLKEYLLFLPSLIMAEILALGYAVLLGASGIKFKIKSIADALRTKIVLFKKYKNKGALFNSLDWKIPIEQLKFNKLDQAIKVFANKIFKYNYKVIRRCQ